MVNVVAEAYYSERDGTWRGILKDSNGVTRHMCFHYGHTSADSADKCARQHAIEHDRAYNLVSAFVRGQ